MSKGDSESLDQFINSITPGIDTDNFILVALGYDHSNGQGISYTLEMAVFMAKHIVYGVLEPTAQKKNPADWLILSVNYEPTDEQRQVWVWRAKIGDWTGEDEKLASMALCRATMRALANLVPEIFQQLMHFVIEKRKY